jgi:hypothetical protein
MCAYMASPRRKPGSSFLPRVPRGLDSGVCRNDVSGEMFGLFSFEDRNAAVAASVMGYSPRTSEGR